MVKQISVLQIGDNNNFVKLGYLPESLNWYYIEYTAIEDFTQALEKEQKFHLVMITTPKVDDSLMLLDKHCDPYCVMLIQPIEPKTETLQYFFNKKLVFLEEITDIKHFMDNAVHRFFDKQYGARFHIKNMKFSSDFTGEIMYQGNEYLQFKGDFGNQFAFIASWKYNVPVNGENPINLWPEYEKDETVSIQYVLRFLRTGSTDVIYREVVLNESDLENQVMIAADEGYMSVSIYAKGAGILKIGRIHYRFSHFQSGDFLVGGQRIVDSRRQEIIHYYYPGDLKPPLNVYFSGYRSAEGFEGYWMMKSLGAPFILISDPRLEGGAFYIGSDELESQIVEIISSKLNELGFDRSQLVLSGISMGTYGAMYYSSKLNPYAIVLSKPLANLGDIALNAKYHRPGDWTTSLDILSYHTGDLSENSARILNKRFWDSVNSETIRDTKISVVYMMQDDYDGKAYFDLLEKLQKQSVQITSKGLIGRHVDNAAEAVSLFYKRYIDLMSDFGRSIEA